MLNFGNVSLYCIPWFISSASLRNNIWKRCWWYVFFFWNFRLTYFVGRMILWQCHLSPSLKQIYYVHLYTCYWSPLPHFCLYSNADILMNDVRTNACIICYVCVYTWPRKAQTCPDKTKDCILKNEKRTILGSTVLCPFDSELRSWWQGPCQVQLRAPLLMNSSADSYPTNQPPTKSQPSMINMSTPESNFLRTSLRSKKSPRLLPAAQLKDCEAAVIDFFWGEKMFSFFETATKRSFPQKGSFWFCRGKNVLILLIHDLLKGYGLLLEIRRVRSQYDFNLCLQIEFQETPTGTSMQVLYDWVRLIRDLSGYVCPFCIFRKNVRKMAEHLEFPKLWHLRFHPKIYLFIY